MLVVKFQRTYPSDFISHVDILKTMNRILRRADIEVEYSQGFNPHMLLFFSPPLPVGISSESEYVTVAAKKTDDFLQRFNAACPSGMKGLTVFESEKNPNLAHIITSATYRITGNGIGTLDIKKLTGSAEFPIRYTDKGKETVKEYRNYLLDIKRDGDDALTATLKFGNDNLRADRFVTGLYQFFNKPEQNVEIVKLDVFDKNGVKIDDILKN